MQRGTDKHTSSLRKIHFCTGINTRPSNAFQQGQDIFYSSTEAILTGSGAHPESYSIGSGVLSLGRSVKSTIHFHIQMRLRISGAMPLLPLSTLT